MLGVAFDARGKVQGAKFLLSYAWPLTPHPTGIETLKGRGYFLLLLIRNLNLKQFEKILTLVFVVRKETVLLDQIYEMSGLRSVIYWVVA